MPSLAKNTDCTGCEACFNACPHAAISMLSDCEGFLAPIVNHDKCMECKLCEKSCPVITPVRNNGFSEPKAYALWSYPDRTKSSSGGAFSAFARMVINKGGVVYGAAFDEHLHLRHIKVDKIEGLDELRGSKYVQSRIGDTYKSIRIDLRQGRYVLFCGTPCQVAGLKDFLHKDYDRLLLLDLACHGVPSDSVWQSYLSKLALKKGKRLTDYDFRRRDGWGFQPSARIDGKRKLLFGIDSLFMAAFDKNALFRKSCYHCQYSNPHRVGDCSIADFWGLGRQGIPFRHDVMKGVSLVLVNNKKGAKALSNLDKCFIEERPLGEALAHNANLNHPSSYNKDRDNIIAAFISPELSLMQIDKKFHLVNHGIKESIKDLAVKWNVFTPAKRLYNFIMANKQIFKGKRNSSLHFSGGG